MFGPIEFENISGRISLGKILEYFCSIVASVMMCAPLMMCGELELLTFKGKINKISQQTFASVLCIEILFRIKKIRFL